VRATADGPARPNPQNADADDAVELAVQNVRYAMGLGDGGEDEREAEFDPSVRYTTGLALRDASWKGVEVASYACESVASAFQADAGPLFLPPLVIDLRRPRPWGVETEALVDGLRRSGDRRVALWLIWN
jgi:hypothetical protein